jgi:two-component system, NarL family, invasion response regulator UvrY
MAKILIADDHPMVRAGLRAMLAESGFDNIGQAGSAAETLAMLQTDRWDLLILDISMPDRSGMEVLREVRSGYPATKVLVLSIFPERQYALNVIKGGASGYLPKECATKELLEAVRTVLQGRRYVGAETAELLVTDMDKDGSKPLHARLSEREFQIFCKLAAGYSVTSVSNELCLSVKTVSTYRARVLEKMSLATNADMTMYALRHDLIQGALHAEPA